MQNQPQCFNQNEMQERLEALGEDEVILIKRDKEKSQTLEIYQYQVSGKTPKYIDNVHGFIFKKYSDSQHRFYQFLKTLSDNDKRSQLKKYIPQYLGTFEEKDLQGMSELKNAKKQQSPQKSKPKQLENSQQKHRNLWIEHISSREDIKPEQEQKYICLKNLTFNYENPNILDLKLGRKKPKKTNFKFQDSTTNSHCFRINGMVTQLHNNQEYQQYFISKYFGQKITIKQVQNYLALFFFNGKCINHTLVQLVIQQLQKLIACFKKFTGVKFISSSLFISFDADYPEHFSVRLIDFDKYEHDQAVIEDTNISEGLEHICRFLDNIALDIKTHQSILLNKELEIFKKDVVVVPQSKIQKYKSKTVIQQAQ